MEKIGIRSECIVFKDKYHNMPMYENCSGW